MPLGDYVKTTFVEGSAPGISAQRLNNNENKTAELDQAVNVHLADFVRNPAYGPTTGGTGTPNAYLFSSTPALPALVDGVSAYLDVNVANTGAATLNWDNTGAHSIVDGKGGALIAGKMPLNGIVGVRYNASTGNFQLLGEGGDYGTAGAAQTLTGYTLGTVNGVIPGTMPNLSGNWQSTTGDGVYNGGASGYGVLGRIPRGYSDGSANSDTLVFHPDFIASNILAGKAPFGLAGTATVASLGGKRYAKGTTNTDGSGNLIVGGLAFQPSIAICKQHWSGNRTGLGIASVQNADGSSLYAINISTNTSNTFVPDPTFTPNSSGFTLGVLANATTAYDWLVFE